MSKLVLIVRAIKERARHAADKRRFRRWRRERQAVRGR
jgi:hypothetical protein